MIWSFGKLQCTGTFWTHLQSDPALIPSCLPCRKRCRHFLLLRQSLSQWHSACFSWGWSFKRPNWYKPSLISCQRPGWSLSGSLLWLFSVPLGLSSVLFHSLPIVYLLQIIGVSHSLWRYVLLKFETDSFLSIGLGLLLYPKQPSTFSVLLRRHWGLDFVVPGCQ